VAVASPGEGRAPAAAVLAGAVGQPLRGRQDVPEGEPQRDDDDDDDDDDGGGGGGDEEERVLTMGKRRKMRWWC
jgi:hypothetical protein